MKPSIKTTISFVISILFVFSCVTFSFAETSEQPSAGSSSVSQPNDTSIEENVLAPGKLETNNPSQDTEQSADADISSSPSQQPTQSVSIQAELKQTSAMMPALSTEGDYKYTLINGDTEAEITAYAGTDSVITIPTTLGGKPVTTIGTNAFFNLEFLTSVTIPEGVTEVKSSAFAGCGYMTNLSLPDSLTTVGDSAFAGLENAVFTLPAHLTNIGDSAFTWCKKLKMTKLPAGASVGSNAFSFCAGLTTVTVPASVTNIGANAFSQCYSLKTVYFEGNALSGYSGNMFGFSVVTIYYKKGATGWTNPWNSETCLPYDEDDFDYTTIGGGTAVEVTGYKGSSATTVVPGTIGGLPVVSIAASVFESRTGLSSIILPSSVTSIGSRAFFGCTGIHSLDIPGDITIVNSGAFSGCSNLAAVTLPESVTSLGDSAFFGCSALINFKIPANVQSIGSNAFNGCSGLVAATLPDTLTQIGEAAFHGCTSLKTVYIPPSVTQIGANAYQNCTSLTSAYFAGAAQSGYADSMFQNTTPGFTIFYKEGATGWANPWNGYPCLPYNERDYTFRLTNLDTEVVITGYTGHDTDVAIPSTIQGKPVTAIDMEAFYQHTEIHTVYIPVDVNSVYFNAFSGCTNLSEINVDSANKTYSSKNGVLFKNTTELAMYPAAKTDATYIVPEYVTSIYAFLKNPYLQTVIIPDTVVYISAFDGCSALAAINVSAGNTSFYSLDGVLFNASNKLIRYPEGKTGENYSVPASVTGFGDGAFKNCIHLKNVTLPDGITQINMNLFIGCTGLESVSLPDSVTSIGFGAFGGCSNLKTVNLPYNVTTIENGAFAECTSLQGITLPGGLKNINTELFYGCTGLASIILPLGLQGINSRAFCGCTSLQTISIPGSVAGIGPNAFQGCTGLQTVSIGDGVGSIGAYAFEGCSGLQSISIPDSVTSIGGRAFYGCTSLQSFSLPDGLTNISDSIFSGCTGLVSITIPDTVNSIGDSAFYGCSRLTTINGGGMSSAAYKHTTLSLFGFGLGSGAAPILVASASTTIPGSIKSIGPNAFYGCLGLVSITIPSTVTVIGANAFSGCTNLVEVHFLGNCHSGFDSSMFANTTVGITIYYAPGTSGWTTSWNGCACYPEGYKPVSGSNPGNSSVQPYIIFIGGRVKLIPNVQGGAWYWDKSFVNLAKNGDGTVTVKGLKEGQTTIRYTYGYGEVDYAITIQKNKVPNTGQDLSAFFILVGLSICVLGLILLICLKNKAKSP